MVWQPEVGTGVNRATDKRDFLTKLVAMLTSQHVATVAVNNGGTATYLVGDIMTLTHPGAFLDARFEVTTVSAGVITGLRIDSSGAFSDRVTTVTANVAGTGYVIGDILEITTGAGREKGKLRVDSLTGSGINAVSVFETGGAYGTPPGATSQATRGVGPAAFAGDDVATVDLTTTGLIGTSALAVTGGSGGGSPTVDITLAQTGWTIDDDGSNSANTNDFTNDGVTDEKDVRLVGDATGFTNKPYIFFLTGVETPGVDTRHFLAMIGGVSHNPALTINDQTTISPGRLSDAFNDNGSYMLFPENLDNEVDFWIQADDIHCFFALNENPQAATDNGRYLHGYFGYIDRLGTESEDAYPFLVSGCARDRDALPTTANVNITGIAEQRAIGVNNGPAYIYRTESAGWIALKNSDTVTVQAEPNIVMPFGEVRNFTDAGDPELINFWDQFRPSVFSFKRDRSSPDRIVQLTDGTTPEYYLFPLTIVSWNSASNPSGPSDFVRGNIRQVFAIFNTDVAGSAINDFSEDFITIGTDRYRIFHTHVHSSLRYMFIAVKEDI